jgi:integrase
MAKLTARGVLAKTAPGLYGDGDGLYLQVAPSGAKSWIYRATLYGKRVAFGLGSLSVLSLAEARVKSNDFKRIIDKGGDPRLVWGKRNPAFEAVARDAFDQLRGKWKSEGHAQRWWASLERDVLPRLGKREVSSITSADVLTVLGPIWAKKPDTARRVAQRISLVIEWAKACKQFEGENPCIAARTALGTAPAKVTHRASMPWADCPAFWARLAQEDGTAALAHRFLLLTAGRAGEVLGARWSEIEGDLWTIPAARMKMDRAHRVPLSEAALGVLAQARGLDPEIVFPSPLRAQRARLLTSNALSALRDRMGVAGITSHGFRTSFRTWAAESARAPNDVAELCLAHVTGKKVERAYQRSDLLDQRRELLGAWARHLTATQGKVVALIR